MNFPPTFACFFCGVDSRVLLYFFLLFVFSMVLASVSFLIWAMTKGDFKNIEAAKYDIFNDPEAGQPQTVSVLPPRAKPVENHENLS